MNRHMRAVVLMLRIFGVILLCFSAFFIFLRIMGMRHMGETGLPIVAYASYFLPYVIGLFAGIGCLIAAGAIRKRHS